MSKEVAVLSELTNAVISAVFGILMENNVNAIRRAIDKQILVKTIKKREKVLISKYKDRFVSFNKMKQDSFYKWLKEKETIKKILSFNNAEDANNMSAEQIRYCKELFLIDAFDKAKIYDLCEKEELRELLNDLFEYVDELLWKSLDEKVVFTYKKCVLEIRQLIREFTENIIREIHYHGSFAEYIDSRKVLQDVPFELDYRSEKIPFVGRMEEIKKIDAFCASEKQISWWTIIGKGGSGKSRLAYQYIKNNMHSADWKMCFLHDEFFKQIGGGKYKLWHTWTYDKNLLLVVDCVQKYAKELTEWIDSLSNNNTVTRKIRILILERTSEESLLWTRGVFDKNILESLKYEEGFFKLQSLNNDLISFAIKYAEKNKKQISEADIMDAWNKLKIIDPDERILYFIMILEAVLNKKPWRNWRRNDLVDYIVKKEVEDIDVRFQGDRNTIRSFSIVLAFCTATKGVSPFEICQDLPEIIKKELKEIRNNITAKDELCASMQLKDGVLQPFVPDIIGEFLVLHIIDQYFLNKEEKEEFINHMWSYDPDNFNFFIFRLVQDKIAGESYNDIIQFMFFDAVPHDNIAVMENYSKLMFGLTNVGNRHQISICFKALEQVYHEYPSNKIITLSYALGLINIISKQELPERQETIEKLELLAAENTDMQIIYAKGLVNLSSRQKLPELQETIKKLELLSVEYADNTDIQTTYAQGLANLCFVQKLPEIQWTIEKLERLAIQYTGDANIQMAYARGLDVLCTKQKLPENRKTIEMMEHLALKNTDNADIQTIYASELYNLLHEQELIERKVDIEKLESTYTENVIIKVECKAELGSQILALELPEVEEIMGKLESLAIENSNNINIQIMYMMGLSDLCFVLDISECEEVIKKLKKIAEKYAGNEDIQAIYVQGLVNLSCRQRLPERNEIIEQLETLARKYANNIKIQESYALGLVNLSCVQQGFLEIKKTIRKLEGLAAKYIDNLYIQEQYAKGLNNLCCRHGQTRSEIDETVEKLAHLAGKHIGSEEIQTSYARGIFNVFHILSPDEKKENVGKLECLAKEHTDNDDIRAIYAAGLCNLSMKLQLPEKNEVIVKLENLAIRNADNTMIQIAYAKGLFSLSYEQEMPGIKETIEKLGQLVQKYSDTKEISVIYAEALNDFSSKLHEQEKNETKKKLEQLIARHKECIEILPEYVDVFLDISDNQEIPETNWNYEKLEYLSVDTDNI